MDRQPTLKGGHVRLRPLRDEDWPALFAVAADPAIWALHPAHDRWQEEVFRGYFDDALAGGGALVIEDAATGAVIGSSRYGEPAGDRIEIGWTFLARSHWGGAINREVKRLMIGHALRDVRAVVFRVGPDNLRSRAALEKIGARLTDERDTIAIRGEPVEHLVYLIDRIPA